MPVLIAATGMSSSIARAWATTSSGSTSANFDAGGVLGRDPGGDDGSRVTTEYREREDVGLHPGAAGGIGAAEDQYHRRMIHGRGLIAASTRRRSAWMSSGSSFSAGHTR